MSPIRVSRASRSLIIQIFMVCLLFVLALPDSALADGLVVVEGVYRQPAVSHISVRIEDKIATTTLEQTFRNTLDKQVDAVYVAPVPPSATILSFAQLIDGEWVEATIKDSDEAKKEYEIAATKGADAALMSGQIVTAPDPSLSFQTRIVLPPQAERTIRLVYTDVLVGAPGLTRYTYPLRSSHLSEEPVGDLLVRVHIVEHDEIRAVYSPSHTVELNRAGKADAEAVYRAQNVVPDKDFELVYTQSADQFGLNLASYRDPVLKEDGYFVLIAAPQLQASQEDVIAKDFVFVLDRSGSMNGAKFEQARAALKRILDALNPGDRFTIIAFDTNVISYSDRVQDVEREREPAKRWVDGLQIDGGTNINESLLTALRTVDLGSGRPHIVVFLTDGQATEGVTDTAAILNNVRTSIKPASRLYTIGIGDVNQPLLESLAQENRGTALFLDAYGAIEEPLRDFYAAIDSPVLVDLALDFGGVEVYDVHPNPIPDMFLGGQVVLTGRYKGGGLTTVTLTGRINGQPHTSTYKAIQFVDAAAAADSANAAKVKANQFVPRLWAQRKVDSLVRYMAIHGPDEARIAEVKTLGLKYQIVTPYTSLVVTDPKAGVKPALPKTGLPFLYADDYRTLNTALLIGGTALILLSLLGRAVQRRRA